MGYIFSVAELKKKVDAIIDEALDYVEIDFFDPDEIEGERIGATIEFMGVDKNGEEYDFGGIEEIEPGTK